MDRFPQKNPEQPWPDYFVDWNRPNRTHTINEFSRVLDAAKDEHPLQELFAREPPILALVLGAHRCWLFPKPRLGGGQLIPDFLFCDLCSLGPSWTLIELESPKASPVTSAGSVSRECHKGIEQIQDYRRWLLQNASFEDQHGWYGINAECKGWVIIGRREEREAVAVQRLADYRRDQIEIASYDRILDYFIDHQNHIDSRWRKIKELANDRPE